MPRIFCTTVTTSGWATGGGGWQWTPDRNGGFSRTGPQRLYLPPIMDAIYGYQALNVEAQQRNAASFLQWARRMIEIRKRHPAFGTGSYEELTSSNPSVLAFVRLPSSEDPDSDGSDRILCVNNLSRFPRSAGPGLRRFTGVTPVECMGGVVFPRFGQLTYLLTLPGHGFPLVPATRRVPMAALTVSVGWRRPDPARTTVPLTGGVVSAGRHRTGTEADGRPSARQ
jgi:maltose alpha-D-glucosyltransferase/alpha-amylase